MTRRRSAKTSAVPPAAPPATVREPKAVRIPKAAELIADSIRRRIVLGELAEGDALPSEAKLMAEFGVSRPTLREAFRILESESLIHVRRGVKGGARIRLPSANEAARVVGLILQVRGATLQEVLDARALIEPPLAGMLAERGARSDARAFAKLVEQERALALAGDATGFALTTAEFHQTLIDRAGNKALAVIVGTLHEIFQRHATQFVARTRRFNPLELAQRAIANHEKLVTLIEQRRPAEAEKHWRKHMELVRDITVQELRGPTVVELY